LAREGPDGDLQSSDYLKRLLQQRAAVSATATMRIPVAVHLVEQHRSERAIIFHERRDAADRILALLRERGHSATIYHAGIGGAIRRENLRLFRRGVHDVLVCCRALDEGMNVPETSVAVVASSTASQRQRIQRLGRILRPAKGKDSATVYTLYATEEERTRLIKEAADLKQVSSVTWHESRRRTDG
jgi:superfamily II DNA or RNA helicase